MQTGAYTLADDQVREQHYRMHNVNLQVIIHYLEITSIDTSLVHVESRYKIGHLKIYTANKNLYII